VAIYTEDVLEIHTDVQGFAYNFWPAPRTKNQQRTQHKGKSLGRKVNKPPKEPAKPELGRNLGQKKRMSVKGLGARGFELVSLPSQLLIFICLVISSIPFLQVACCQAERSFELPYK